MRWPLAHMLDLLEDPDFYEARNVSALFLVREWLKGQGRWPLAHMLDLLEDPDFYEARNVSALFLVREWLKGQGRV